MISSKNKLLALLAAGLIAVAPLSAQESFVGSFAEPADGGNLDVVHSTFDGNIAVLSPRWHESEALGSGTGARRWRNLLFAIRGVQGRIVTFRLPMQLPASSVMVHNMDSTSFNRLKPVWSGDASHRTWTPFTTVTRYKPNALDILGLAFPLNSLVDLLGTLTVSTGSARKEDYGWEFKNTTPFTSDVVYISINEHYPVQEYYDWLEASVFPHAWVAPTASQVLDGTFLIGYQSGAAATSNPNAFARTIPDLSLYAFKIQDPAQRPTKLVILASGQHPYEGQNKAALRGAIEWILNPTDPEAAAYRSQYVTLVYPFINPTGEYAGLWRGTAYAPLRDTNRHWDTTLVDPAQDRGIDTVIIHKKAMTADVAAIGLGTPYAVFDYHQNFGDHAPNYDYASHANVTAANAFVARLKTYVSIADEVSDPANSTMLRGYWGFKGVPIPMTFERSVYNSLASESAFGAQTVRALAPVVVVTPPPVDPAPTYSVTDTFSGSGTLAGRTPDTLTNLGAKWTTSQGVVSIVSGAATTTNDYLRALIDVGAANTTAEAKIALLGANGYAGLTLRASDANNFLFFRIKGACWVLGRVAAGVGTTLATGSGTYATGSIHTLRAVCSGGTIAVSVNGTTVYTGTQTFNQTATQFGFSSGTAVAFSIDHFTAAPATALAAAAATPAAPSGTLIGDAFTGTGALAGRSPDTATTAGAAWTASGTITVANGVATAGSTFVRALITAGAADATAAANFTLLASDAYAGLVFRATDSNNFLFFRIRPTGWTLGQVVGGAGTTLATGSATCAVGSAHTLGVTCQAGGIELRIDGDVVHQGTSVTLQTATSFGISSGTAAPFSVDDFSVVVP